VTIPLEGAGEFLVENSFAEISKTKIHLQLPGKEFDGKIVENSFRSLQLCFDRAALDSLGVRLQGEEGGEVSLLETLDMARPEVRSFARHALFMWSEILRGGPILTSPLIARESVQLLGALLVSAADSAAMNSESTGRKCPPLAVRRAEDYLMANLSNPISIADVAAAAGTSARTLSREFRRHRETTIKRFLSERRLEAANRELLAAGPGVTNVTQVALNLGFEQLGRFAADYKKAFGELPSETLTR
jgi:AraC-like DNA-binding protein